MLSQFREMGRAAFIPFVVGGYPSMELCERAVDVLVEEGADLLELGVPFSDAMADGPVIQEASEQASKNTQLGDVLRLATRIKSKHHGLPLILFTYFNPILKMGLENFALNARKAGIDAVLVVDLPPEEAQDYCKLMEQAGVRTIFLASPTTDPGRLPLIEASSSGFIYYVSRTGVTGERNELSVSLASEVAALRQRTRRTIAVGFGISTGKQAREVAALGDAVVVGSAFVRLMKPRTSHESAQEMVTRVRSLAKELVAAIRSDE